MPRGYRMPRVIKDGYAHVEAPEGGKRREHIVIAERALGRRLRGAELVHHVNPDDRLTNKGPFVVCPDQTYHGIIERRGRALRECGNANWLMCGRCKKWDDPKNLVTTFSVRRRTVHQTIKGVCVDLDPLRTPAAGKCPAGPRGDHGIDNRRRKKGVPTRSGLEQTCIHCGATIRRSHEKSTWWFAVTHGASDE